MRYCPYCGKERTAVDVDIKSLRAWSLSKTFADKPSKCIKCKSDKLEFSFQCEGWVCADCGEIL
jgi:hypothetical protein